MSGESSTPLMKDGIALPAIQRIADGLSAVWPAFPASSFIEDALAPLEQLELKDRVRHITALLRTILPDDFAEAVPLLLALPDVWDRGDSDDPLRGFAIWPVIQYVPEAGLDAPDLALPVLKALTPLFSSEFAIRPFWLQHFEVTYDVALAWCDDPDPHVRRLVSEGIRPRLPWSPQLKPLIKDPTPIFGLLEQLKDDESEYVRRSVANNLNDVAKDHPERVIALCRDWYEGASEERRWIIRHATRSLVKQGHPEVFGLLGFTDAPQLHVSALRLEDEALTLGDSLSFAVDITSEADEEQRFVVDFAIHFRKANGTTKPKVFKGTQMTLAAGESRCFSKRHAIRRITTRRYYEGEQSLELLINGVAMAHQDFWLSVPD